MYELQEVLVKEEFEDRMGYKSLLMKISSGLHGATEADKNAVRRLIERIVEVKHVDDIVRHHPNKLHSSSDPRVLEGLQPIERFMGHTVPSPSMAGQMDKHLCTVNFEAFVLLAEGLREIDALFPA